MELYRKFPVICTLWAFLEILCFGGVIFGWGSLVYILKEEGFYRDDCLAFDEGFESDIAIPDPIINELGDENLESEKSDTELDIFDVIDNPPYYRSENGSFHAVEVVCPNQDSKLNQWFSLAVSFMYLAFAAIGYLIRRIGTRLTRLIFLIVYLVGTLCLAFATPELPWLLLPGLCFMGTGGLTILATNLQVANLHPHLRSTIVAIFTGLFDFSSVTKHLIKMAYESGIPRRYCYIFVACCFTTIVLISTLFILPHKSISEEMVAEIKRKREGSKRKSIEVEKGEALLEKKEDIAKEEHTYTVEEIKNDQPSLCSVLLSLTVILHLYWLFVHALRFVTFIGLLNKWLEDLTNYDEEKVGSLLGIFAYMTMGAVGTALLCGFVYDWQRNKYANTGRIRQVYGPVVLPMMLVIFYSITTTVLCYIKNSITPYFAFAVFTFFRSSLFTVAVAFVGDAFPLDYFGVLFGFIQFSAGCAGLIQYPIFEWYDAYEGSYEHVNIVLLALQVSTIIHPVLLFIRARRDHTPTDRQIGRRQTLVVPDPDLAGDPESGKLDPTDPLDDSECDKLEPTDSLIEHSDKIAAESLDDIKNSTDKVSNKSANISDSQCDIPGASSC